MVDSTQHNEDPAEGSRETIERGLARSGQDGAGKDGDRPVPRQQVLRRKTKESAETPNHGEESSFRRAARKISSRARAKVAIVSAALSAALNQMTVPPLIAARNRGDFIADKIPRRFNETTKRSSDTRHPSFPRRVCRHIRRHRARQGDRSSRRAHAVRRAFPPPAWQGRGR